jgi:hypothetical protein
MPIWPQLTYGRANALLELGEEEKAIAIFEEMLQQLPHRMVDGQKDITKQFRWKENNAPAAIGTRIKVLFTDNGVKRAVFRDVNSGAFWR